MPTAVNNDNQFADEIELNHRLVVFDDTSGLHVPDKVCEAHVIINEEQIVVDFATPTTKWQDGSRLYIERRASGWCIFIHPDSNDPTHKIDIRDDGSVDVEHYDR